MLPEQWKMCEQMSRELGYKNQSEFIRDAVEFYHEWSIFALLPNEALSLLEMRSTIFKKG